MSVPTDLPPGFVRNMQDLYGAGGPSWLQELPRIIAALEERWDVRVDEPFPNLTYNYVAPARCADGSAAVLKLSPPADPSLGHEARTVRHFDGHGMVRLLEYLPEYNAMLLERLEPGVSLLSVRDDVEATSILASVIRELQRPLSPEHDFRTVADWGKAFDRHQAFYGGPGPLPHDIFELGKHLYFELDATAAERILLHGDLHQDNILSATRAPWLAIDAKGVVGDPVFEVGALLNNLWEDLYPVPNPREVLERRVLQLSEELEFDRDRVRGWGVAYCVLSAVWSAEDHRSGWEGAIERAKILAIL